VYGKTSTTTVELSAASSGVCVLRGGTFDELAGAAVGAADVNGDGISDVLVGITFNDTTASNAGAADVVYGDLPGATTGAGDAGANTLTGSAAVDRLVGGRGDDTLAGNGGADVLYAGQGNDVLAVSDLAFARLDGGTGTDTLRLDGSGFTLDLTNRLLAGRIRNIEALDLSGTGTFLVNLDARAVLNLSSFTNTLTIAKDAADTVNLGSGWDRLGDEVIGGQVYNVFQQGRAVVKISDTTPTITSLTSATANGAYGVGATINVTVVFSQPVTLAGGALTVNLDSGGAVAIAPFGPAASAAGTGGGRAEQP
jgi:hypothetical protein